MMYRALIAMSPKMKERRVMKEIRISVLDLQLLYLLFFLGPLNPPQEERHGEESLTWRVAFFLVSLNPENYAC